MAVDFLRQTFGRTYTHTATGEKSAVRMYYMKLDTPVNDLNDVLTLAIAAGLPDMLDPYSADSSEQGLVVSAHTPKEIDQERAYYAIQVDYATNTLALNSPTSRPWQIEFSTIKNDYVPAMTYADSSIATGANFSPVASHLPIVNTAGYPFDPPVLDQELKVVISLSRNFTAITNIGTIASISDLMSRVNTVNGVSVTIAGLTGTPLQFLIDDIQCKYVEDQGETFYATTFKIVYDPECHVAKVLNAGWIDKNMNPIKGLRGGDITAPWPLDINGDAIRLATPALRAAAAIYRGFCVKEISTFADLGLPTTF